MNNLDLNFVSYNDKVADNVVVSSKSKPTIKQAMASLENYTDLYKASKNENCQYTQLRAKFEPVVAVIYPAVWGWTASYEVKFFDKEMLKDKQNVRHINEGFMSEPTTRKKRQIYTIDGDKATKVDMFEL